MISTSGRTTHDTTKLKNKVGPEFSEEDEWNKPMPKYSPAPVKKSKKKRKEWY